MKSGLSLFNIRFKNAILDSNLEPVTFVKKTNYHAARDKERSDIYRQSQRQRKQTQFFDSSKELMGSLNTMRPVPAKSSKSNSHIAEGHKSMFKKLLRYTFFHLVILPLATNF